VAQSFENSIASSVNSGCTKTGVTTYSKQVLKNQVQIKPNYSAILASRTAAIALTFDK
jgi:hypothetical protein